MHLVLRLVRKSGQLEGLDLIYSLLVHGLCISRLHPGGLEVRNVTLAEHLQLFIYSLRAQYIYGAV